MKNVAGTGAVLCAVALLVAGCPEDKKSSDELDPITSTALTPEPIPTTPATPPSWPTPKPLNTPTPLPKGFKPKPKGQLVIQDLKKGTGAEAKPGNTAVVHYRGTLSDGTKFDASYDRGEPFPFVIGAGSVIRGWDEGVAGMKVGGKRKLTIPPHLAYGPQGRPPVIPPDATLVFEVELMDVKK